MPNHCGNNLIIEVAEGHEDLLDILIERIEAGTLYDFFIPIPECLKGVMAGFCGDEDEQKQLEERYDANRAECGYANWYDFCVSNWGTKWDVYDFHIAWVDEENRMLSVNFNSAWSPPIGVYEAMEAHEGIESIRATYFEPGSCFCGSYEEGFDESYDIEEFTLDWVEGNIPEDICIRTGMYEYMAECEAMEEAMEEEEV